MISSGQASSVVIKGIVVSNFSSKVTRDIRRSNRSENTHLDSEYRDAERMASQFAKHHTALISYAKSLAKSRHDIADDVLQQTYLQAWRNKHRVDYSRCCKPWLLRIMRNEFLQIARRSTCHFVLNEDTVSHLEGVEIPTFSRIDFLDFIRSLSHLSLDQKQAVMMVLAEGYTYQEAAEILGARIGTIKSRVARGREKILDILLHKDAA